MRQGHSPQAVAIEFEQHVFDTLKKLKYEVSTNPPGDSWWGRVTSWLMGSARWTIGPDMIVRDGEKTVMVEVKAYPILLGPLIQASHYASHYNTPILICVPHEVFPEILSSVRESAEENAGIR